MINVFIIAMFRIPDKTVRRCTHEGLTPDPADGRQACGINDRSAVLMPELKVQRQTAAPYGTAVQLIHDDRY